MTSFDAARYQPRTGDGSIPAEDDSLLRQPMDEPFDDPDLAQTDALQENDTPLD